MSVSCIPFPSAHPLGPRPSMFSTRRPTPPPERARPGGGVGLRVENIDGRGPRGWAEGNGMQETDIDDYVEKKRARAEGLTTEEYRAKLCEELRGFREAIEGDPVLAAEFLSYLDLDPLEGFLAGLYRRAPGDPAPALLPTARPFHPPEK